MSNPVVASVVWSHYEKDTTSKGGGGRCRYCGKHIKQKQSTGNLLRHLRRWHPRTLSPRARSSMAQLPATPVGKALLDNQEISRFLPVPKAVVLSTFRIVEEVDKATCLECNSIFKYRSNHFSNLEKHIRTKHPTLLDGFNEAVENKRDRDEELGYFQEAELEFYDVEEDIELETEPMACIEIQLPVVTPPLRIDLASYIFACWVCESYIDLNMTNSDVFDILTCISGNRKFVPPNKKILRHQIFPEIKNKMKILLRRDLKRVQDVSLTLEKWETRTDPFMSLFVHFLTEDLQLQSSILFCETLYEKDDPDEIAGWVLGALREYGIEGKVTLLTTDGTPVLETAANLTNLPHFTCFLSQISSIVHEGIKEVEPLIDRVHSSVKYVIENPEVAAKLKNAQRKMKISRKPLLLEEDEQWRSTFLVLRRFSSNQEAFSRYGEVLEENLADDEWNRLKHVVDLLGFFFEAEREMLKQNSITISKIPIMIDSILKKLDHRVDDKMESVRKMRDVLFEGMKETLASVEKHPCFYHAIFVDPRFKEVALKEVNKYEETLTFFKETLHQNESHHAQKDASLIWSKFDSKTQNQKFASLADTEITGYLGKPLLRKKVGTLKWWMNERMVFPSIFASVTKLLGISPVGKMYRKPILVKESSLEKYRHFLKKNWVSDVEFINRNLKVYQSQAQHFFEN